MAVGISTNNNTKAVAYMLFATAGYALPPLIVDLTNSQNNPFLFNGLWRSIIVIGIFGYLLLWFREILFKINRRFIRRSIFSRDFLWGILSHFSHALFAWSTRFIDTTLSTAIFSLWIIVFIIIRQRDDSEKSVELRRYKPFINKENLILLVFALFGLVFVTLSETGNIDFEDKSFRGVIFGVILAILAAFIGGSVARLFRWADHLFDNHKDKLISSTRHIGDNDLILVIQLIGYILTISIATVLSFMIGLGEGISNINSFFSLTNLYIMIPGGIVASLAPVAFRRTQYLTNNLGVIAISYFESILALSWLFLFTDVSITRIDFLAIGAIIILSVNIILNWEAESNRVGFKWLILVLWSTGLFVLFRDEVFAFWQIGTQGNWFWSNEIGEYYSLLGLSATVFILIFSFRYSRLIERTTREEKLVSILYRKLSIYIQSVNNTDSILLIDKTLDSKVLTREYFYILALLNSPWAKISPLEKVEVQSELDELLLSKKKGRELSEVIVLVFFASVTVLLSLGIRPDTSYGAYIWNFFLIDLFAIIFSSAIIFLTITLLYDLSGERQISIYKIIRTSDINQKIGRNISLILAFMVALVFTILLYDKWIGLF